VQPVETAMLLEVEVARAAMLEVVAEGVAEAVVEADDKRQHHHQWK
jgi:hypothetical protein